MRVAHRHHDRRVTEQLLHCLDRRAAHDEMTRERVALKLKRPWPDGRTHLVMEPVAFLRRLCGIIPPPRRHLVRYSGIFGPASKHRHALRALVPTDRSHEAGDARCTEPRPSQTAGPASRARRLPWADLLRRVFADDVLQCPCGGRRSVVAIVTDSALARVLLAGFGLATEPSTFAPARAPPQADLPWDDAL